VPRDRDRLHDDILDELVRDDAYTVTYHTTLLGPYMLKVLPEPRGATGHHLTLLDHDYGASAASGTRAVYAPAFAGTKLYCLVTEARECERPA